MTATPFASALSHLVLSIGLLGPGMTLVGLASGPALAQEGESEDDGGFVTHKLALQVSDDDEAAMRSALEIAANVSRFYTAKAEEVEITIVVYGPGLAMLRPDRTPVMERLTAFDQSMPNVSFAACGNTMDTIERSEGKRPEIVPFASVVEAGVAELIRLDEDGYTIVKP
ncbi:DsrE family protein [Fulvimarina sp. 2208YS6-2-32]|uniref:DsrE family protein n=1 Tax=Fulvimarina uroteuthidis TaxID=3098149 RepID=A0ABU5HY12_9HYPH|nr:DsrE family protein [Fulvimarina sp. 2208YS6-2-32]MDY8107977.1 DsrE family protein [Fulvimarina sp. 2208YS6-2-32]